MLLSNNFDFIVKSCIFVETKASNYFHNMRSFLKACIVSLCVIGLFTACKKDSPDGGDPSGSNTPENVIKYRTMDLQVITPSVVIGEMVSNTYKDGWGQMEFSAPVTSIPANAFKDNKNLVSIEFSNKVESIGGSAFKGCTNLISITTGNGIKTIGTSCFSGCTALKEFAIADGVTALKEFVFENCKSLEKVYVGKGLKEADYMTFSQCTKISQVHIKDLASWCQNHVGGYIIAYSDASPSLYMDNRVLSDVVIPNGLSEINYGVFSYFHQIKSITLPESVISIGSSAFYNCVDLERINFPASLKEIHDDAFYGCKNLKRVDIASIDLWCGFCFYPDDDNPQVPPKNPFNFSHEGHLYLNGKEVTEVSIPNGAKKVEDYSFTNLINLTTVSIPDTVEEIGVAAFAGCSSITSITLPDRVSLIQPSAFSGSGAQSIFMGSGVTFIGSLSFRNCKNLVTIKINAVNPPRLIADKYTPTFEGCDKLTKIIVPSGTLQTYKSTKGWDTVSHLLVEE